MDFYPDLSYQFQSKAENAGNNHVEGINYENNRSTENIVQMPENLAEGILFLLIPLDLIDEEQCESPRKIKRTDSENFLFLGAQVNIQQNTAPLTANQSPSCIPHALSPAMVGILNTTPKTSISSNNELLDLPNDGSSEQPYYEAVQCNEQHSPITSRIIPSQNIINTAESSEGKLKASFDSQIPDKPIDFINIKKTKREKNRVSARECRQRKKQYLRTMEVEVIIKNNKHPLVS